MLIARRGLLVAGASAAMARPAWAQSLAHGAFTHGVASGDPLADGVIIWTRFVGGERIAWEVAEDEAFATVVARGEAEASRVSDFCVKVDVRGLAPGRSYFYRFLAASGPSPTGCTRTAPDQVAQSLSVGLVSCANYGFGHFHAYGHLARRDDIDLVLHTGDYIYEYGPDQYPRAAQLVAGRPFDPDHEIVSLDDYYRRYQQYHTDLNLQALRAAKPLCVVWDDHEIANDASSTGAQNHQRNEGAYADRVSAASKAYFDWMPIRRPDPANARLYRSLDWGDLARIILIDTRLAGRTRQLDYRRALGLRLLSDGARAEAAVEEFRRTQLVNPARTLLGAEQEAWLAATLAASKQRGQAWQIVAQQIAMGEQLVGPGAAAMVAPDAHANVRRYAAIAERLGGMRMPWNLDSWDGYPAARERFLEACVTNAANAVVLGGDSHNAWLNNLSAPDNTSRLAAIEFAGGSVTSPGLEQALTIADPGAREAMMRGANPHLAWCDVTNRGYGALKFTPGACEAEWVAFANVREAEAIAPTVTRFSAAPSAASGPGRWAV